MSSHNFDRGHLLLGKRQAHIFGSFAAPTGVGGAGAANGAFDPTSVKGLGFGYAPNQQGIMALQAAARPGISSVPGVIWVSAGVYTMTLDDSYIDATDWEAHVIPPSGGTLTNIARILTLPTLLGTGGKAPTFTFNVATSGGTLTDFGPTYRIGFHLWLRDSSVGFSKP
jgi:hypothetical protein